MAPHRNEAFSSRNCSESTIKARRFWPQFLLANLLGAFVITLALVAIAQRNRDPQCAPPALDCREEFGEERKLSDTKLCEYFDCVACVIPDQGVCRPTETSSETSSGIMMISSLVIFYVEW